MNNLSYILVIEDNPNVQYTMTRRIEEAGHRVLCTDDILTADSYLENNPGLGAIKYIFVDLSIPCPDDYFSEDEKTFAFSTYGLNNNGWLWLKRKLSKYQEIQEKVFVCSARKEYYHEYEEIKKMGIPYINKGEPDAFERVIENLK